MLELKDLRLKDVMSPLDAVLRETDTVSAAAAQLLDERHVGAPVVDAQGDLLGVISTTDLLRYVLSPDADREASLKDAGLTNRSAITMDEGESLTEACQAIVRGRAHRLLVLRRGNHPVGIFSVVDAARTIAALADLASGE